MDDHHDDDDDDDNDNFILHISMDFLQIPFDMNWYFISLRLFVFSNHIIRTQI